jgi:peptide/nickel transport system substrate-binding protein
MPVVSRDGLTWTIRLRPGLHYAPPLADRAITAGDIVRAIERALRLPAGSPNSAYEVVEGATDYESGKTDSIAGLQTPDERTLVLHLARPSGDLPNRLAFPDAAPVPLRVTEGHDHDYSRFLVSSGPYMIEGSEKVDFSLPPTQQVPAAGFRPGQSLNLVRNPSWDPRTDHLRPAYVDRIEFTQACSAVSLAAAVESGRIDLAFVSGPSPQLPLDIINRFEASSMLRRQLFVDSRDFLRGIIMNLAVPPFDDVHVRKAVNRALNKEAIRRLAGGPPAGEIAGHLVPNSLENNLLADYDPYATGEHGGNLDAAKAEMRLSRYDKNRDGVCDDPSCQGIVAVSRGGAPFETQARLMAADLKAIGLDLAVQTHDLIADPSRYGDPHYHDALYLDISWGAGAASDTFISLFSSPSGQNNSDWSLVGASSDQLRAWGYTVTSTPSVEPTIQRCLSLEGGAQLRCWAETDQLLMEAVVPWAPYLDESYTTIVSARVVHYSYDQINISPALDQIALGQ